MGRRKEKVTGSAVISLFVRSKKQMYQREGIKITCCNLKKGVECQLEMVYVRKIQLSKGSLKMLKHSRTIPFVWFLQK